MRGVAWRPLFGLALLGGMTACGARASGESLWDGPAPGRAEGASLEPGAEPNLVPTAPAPTAQSNALGTEAASPLGAQAAAPSEPAQRLSAEEIYVAEPAPLDEPVVVQSEPVREKERVVGFNVTGSSIVASTRDCSVWLDERTDGLVEQDIIVRHDDVFWEADVSCESEPAWYLAFDTEGTWLGLCPGACEQLKNDPELVLEVEAVFRSTPKLVVR